MMGEYLGYTREEMSEIVKFKFLKTETADETTGEVFQYVKSTTKLSTVEFMELINKLYEWASSTFGISLPEPNTQIGIDYSNSQ